MAAPSQARRIDRRRRRSRRRSACSAAAAVGAVLRLRRAGRPDAQRRRSKCRPRRSSRALEGRRVRWRCSRKPTAAISSAGPRPPRAQRPRHAARPDRRGHAANERCSCGCAPTGVRGASAPACRRSVGARRGSAGVSFRPARPGDAGRPVRVRAGRRLRLEWPILAAMDAREAVCSIGNGQALKPPRHRSTDRRPHTHARRPSLHPARPRRLRGRARGHRGARYRAKGARVAR